MKYYRLCPKGHKVIYESGGACPKRCPVCNLPVALSSPRKVYDEKEEQQEETGQAPINQGAEPEESRNDPEVSKYPQRVREAGRVIRREEKPEVRRESRENWNQKVEELERNSEIREEAGIQLNCGGVTFQIAPDGAWMGRDGLGKNILEGNLLISRKHAFIKKAGAQRVSVQDMGSKNGTFYENGTGTGKMPVGPEGVILKPGDILWIYNVPFMIEEKEHE